MAVKSRPDSYAGKPIVSLEGGEGEDKENVTYKSWRRKMDMWLNSVGFQTTIVVVVLLQVPILTALLLINFNIIHSPHRGRGSLGTNHTAITNGDTVTSQIDERVAMAERVLHTLNIVLLLLFLIEIVARVAARGAQIHKDKKQIFDCGVVMLTFVLYVAFTATNIRRAAYSVGFIIILRLWRISRICKGIAVFERRKLQQTLATHRKAQKVAEEQLNLTLAKMAAVQQEVEVLQRQLKVVHYVGKASPAISSSGLSKMSEDLVTSDEEGERYVDCESTQNVQVEMTYNGSIPSIASGSPSPAASSMHLVDEFPVGSETKESVGTPKPTQKINVPDLVEDTQTAETAILHEAISEQMLAASIQSNPSFTKDDNLREPDQHNGEYSGPHPRLQMKQQDLSPRAENRTSSEQLDKPRIVMQLKDDKSQAPTEFPTGASNGGPEMCENTEGGCVNQAFEGESTPQEQAEIKRVAQVPFDKDYGSTTYLSEEGIPMTDL